MKLFKPSRMSSKSSVGKAKLSSHLVKPAKFASSKVSIKAPRFSSGKTTKVKVNI